jgi:type IV secretory pathway TrbD component
LWEWLLASVGELKNALQAEREAAADLAEASMAAISSILALSTWVLAVLGIVLACVAIVGWVAVHKGAQRKAAEVAKRHVQEHIKGQGFSDMLEKLIQDEVREKLSQTHIVHHIRQEANGNGNDPFPQPPDAKGE